MNEEILQALKGAREQMGLSQRGLSARVGMPQSHISKIESGATDLRLSSLVELARTLELELVLVPRKLVPAVEAIVRTASTGESPQRARVLERLVTVLTRLSRTYPEHPELRRLEQTVRELGNFQLGPAELAIIRDVADRLTKAQGGAQGFPAFERASRQLQDLRNRIARALPEPPRPAYSLDEDDDA